MWKKIHLSRNWIFGILVIFRRWCYSSRFKLFGQLSNCYGIECIAYRLMCLFCVFYHRMTLCRTSFTKHIVFSSKFIPTFSILTWSAFAFTNANYIAVLEDLHALYMWNFCFESCGCILLINQLHCAFYEKFFFLLLVANYPLLKWRNDWASLESITKFQ